MPNYKNGKVYKIVCNTTGKVYIGSTTVLLCKRLAEHVNKYKRGVYTSSKEILDGGNYSIVLIENVECETKEQLLRRERYYIESIECVNKYRPIVSVEEAKAKHKEYHKEYRENNKEIKKDKDKERYESNKAKHKERSKEYYNDNKEVIIEKIKERRLKQKQQKQKAIEKAIEELHIAVERVPE